METPQYQVVRIWKTTHKLLRQIAADNEESIVATIDRLARQEREREQGKERTNDAPKSV